MFVFRESLVVFLVRLFSIGTRYSPHFRNHDSFFSSHSSSSLFSVAFVFERTFGSNSNIIYCFRRCSRSRVVRRLRASVHNPVRFVRRKLRPRWVASFLASKQMLWSFCECLLSFLFFIRFWTFSSWLQGARMAQRSSLAASSCLSEGWEPRRMRIFTSTKVCDLFSS